jgi:YegS/Rv2252/BmrU family lipid kinase
MSKLAPSMPLADSVPRNVTVIYNPTAGRRRRRRFEATLAALRALGCAARLLQTTGPGHAEQLARTAAAEQTEILVVAGGDGTINDAVNGLVGPGAGAEPPPLAVLPLGTANALAAEIGLDLDPGRIARTIARGRPVPVSLGRANERLFVMMAGVGFDAHVVEAVSLDLKRLLGKGAYVWEAARALRRFAFPGYRVRLDGADHEAASVIVAKGHFYGGRFVCAPEARLAEPLFQVCLFTRPGAWNALRYAAALGVGRLSSLPDYKVLPAREVRIEGPEGDPVQGDGDVIARLPLELRVLPEALKIVMPPEAAPEGH